MVPNPQSPRESRTPGDPQPGSGNPLSPRSPLSNWMELRSKMCMVQPASSSHLLVTLQNSFGTGGTEGQGRASSRSQQGQSGGSSGTPKTSTLSQPKPSAGRPLSPGKEVAPAQPQWPNGMAVTNPKPPPGGPKSSHRRAQHLYTPKPPQQPPAQPDARVMGSVFPLLAPDCPPQSSPPWREKSTQSQATKGWHRATRPPQRAPSEGLPRANPGRALPKLVSSLWWPEQQAETQGSPCPTSPLAGQQPNATKAVAKGTSGSGKDMAKSALPGRASLTNVLHEAPTQSCSGDDGDKALDTGFFAFLEGKFGQLCGRESTAAPLASQQGGHRGWGDLPWGTAAACGKEGDTQQGPHRAGDVQREEVLGSHQGAHLHTDVWSWTGVTGLPP